MSLKREKARSMSSQPYATPQVLFCRGCQRPCRTQSALDSHQRICQQLKLGKHDSFFKLDPLRSGPPSCNVPTALQNLMAPKDTSEKVLPLSQSLEDTHSTTKSAEAPSNKTTTTSSSKATSSSREKSRDDVVPPDKILPLSQPEVPSTKSSASKNCSPTTVPVPLSTNIDCSQTAGGGINRSSGHSCYSCQVGISAIFFRHLILK